MSSPSDRSLAQTSGSIKGADQGGRRRGSGPGSRTRGPVRQGGAVFVPTGAVSDARADQWAVNQASIALGSLLSAAALLGMDACPIEGFSAPDYDRILGLEGSPYRTAVVAALGYRSPEDRYASLAKVRCSREELIERR